MVPEEIRGSACAGEKKIVDATGKEEEQTGCGKGLSQGGEMSQFEKQLQENEKAQDREVEIKISPPSITLKEKKKTPTPTKATKVTKKQQLGQCRKCGYMSSQELCKACVILDDLNKNRPKIEVVLDEEDEDASSSVRKKMEAIDMSGVEI